MTVESLAGDIDNDELETFSKSRGKNGRTSSSFLKQS